MLAPDNMRESTEVACLQYGIRKLFRAGSHGAIEDLAFVRVLRPILPNPHAMDVVERSGAGAHCVQEIAPRMPVVRPADQLGHWRVRPSNVTPKKLAGWGQPEPVAVMLMKYADRSECAHQSIERSRVRVGRLSKLTAGFRSRRQPVGQSKGDGNMDRLANLEPENELEQIGSFIACCHVRMFRRFWIASRRGNRCVHLHCSLRPGVLDDRPPKLLFSLD